VSIVINRQKRLKIRFVKERDYEGGQEEKGKDREERELTP
jgi:hypothetical protein